MHKLQPGDKAPLFESIDHNGKPIKLSDFAGKKVVLYFYPEDDTPTCTIQACNLRDNYSDLQAQGYHIIGISPDSPEMHRKFKAKFSLPYTLVSDPDKVVHNLYGTWGEKNMYGRKYMGVLRHTFVIDEKGIIVKAIRKVFSNKHSSQLMSSN